MIPPPFNFISARVRGDVPAFWRYWTLVHRILAVNILPILIVALGILWLDAYRTQLRNERVDRLAVDAMAAARASAQVPMDQRLGLLSALGSAEGARLRIYDPTGKLVADSWEGGAATYELQDPDSQRWTKKAARIIDRGFNALVAADPIEPYEEPRADRAEAWPEIAEARDAGDVVTRVREAPDRTPVFTAAAPTPRGGTLLASINDRDYTDRVRRQRSTLAVLLSFALLVGIGMSLFLARTIARPLRRIALAAHRVRTGRARQVNVPRLPRRHDEVGALARAVSDMSKALQERIDKIEAFAADVSHELKNPLASLRSAVDSLERVDDPKVRARLLDVVRQDVIRLDRLISDISEAARTDAELTRAQLEPVPIDELARLLIRGWEERRETGNARFSLTTEGTPPFIVFGEPTRLARAIDNLIDNAVSFSPPKGRIAIAIARKGAMIRLTITDEGPGVPEDERDAIFHRFHSHRPEKREFGRHSGLGLAIARAIVEGHDGDIMVCDRDDGAVGACFTILLPGWEGA
ncbi:sensor histidine kinase [Sphingomicrobium aestuariivivum]|uniref:sensor histidine kinase n=1 Tax=Sphingomicrobium aestuariivivum TaxID=1582356 RepID=UPI001FD6E566|nr:stimulus-sensing domain-containing protein [Sphingomicrobium aestuariivivum]MCJ8190052.1 stimulus-sensing domain-containing protein [Sphingomicrobium aestuariivivum]